ncbi:hypothetical protein C0J52_01197 [Blattella germanica]|nr:hypothetical protein C0J52_01197 [Blattella germanica]
MYNQKKRMEHLLTEQDFLVLVPVVNHLGTKAPTDDFWFSYEKKWEVTEAAKAIKRSANEGDGSYKCAENTEQEKGDKREINAERKEDDSPKVIVRYITIYDDPTPSVVSSSTSNVTSKQEQVAEAAKAIKKKSANEDGGT